MQPPDGVRPAWLRYLETRANALVESSSPSVEWVKTKNRATARFAEERDRATRYRSTLRA